MSWFFNVGKGNVKGNQANLRNLQKISKFSKIEIYIFSKILRFFRISKNYIFLKRKLSRLELRKAELLFFMLESGEL